MLEVDERSDGHEVSLAVGEMLEICLPENPTAGYRWRLDSKGEPILQPAGNAYESGDGPRIPGRGGVHRWWFKAVLVGSARLELSYRRSWEPAVSPARTFGLRVRVTD